MSTSADGPLLCTMCDSKGALLCVQCHSGRYCSAECQRTDWPTHKLLCRSFSDFRVPPGPLFRRAILFPVHEKKPKFVWVEVIRKVERFGDESEDDASGDEFELPKMGDLLGARDPRPSWPQAGRNIVPEGVAPLEGELHFQVNVLQNRALDHTIEVVFRDGFLIDGSFPNESVARVTKGAHAHAWAGPIVVFRKKGIDGDTAFYDDMSLADFRHAVDYFVTYYNDAYANESQDEVVLDESWIKMSLNPGTVGKEGAKGNKSSNKQQGPTGGAVPKVKGVRISCEADQRLCRADKYVQVKVADGPSVPADPGPIPISRLIELPIVVRKCPPEQHWESYLTGADNQPATFLHLNLDPTSDLFGWAPLGWQRGVGSVLAMRVDRKPLSPHHMDALCYFCQFKLQPVIEDALEGERTREEVMRYMTKAKFEKFFIEYKAEQGRSWRNTPSPYAV